MLRNAARNYFGTLVHSLRLSNGSMTTLGIKCMNTGAVNLATDFKIEHDTKKQKFIVNLDPDNSAFINYERLGNDEVLLYHTEVPENFRSTGVAKILAQEVIKHFEDSKQKMVITCTYLQKVDKEMKRAKTA